jgi:hypothetical protein
MNSRQGRLPLLKPEEHRPRVKLDETGDSATQNKYLSSGAKM